MRLRRNLSFSFVLLSLACRRTPSPSEGSATSAESTASVLHDGPAGRSRDEAEASNARKRRGEELVTRWLAAQNARDFDAYARLYAAKFTGIKRSGGRTRKMDRGAWLVDRKGMFERPFGVEATDVRAVAESGLVAVTFEQTWQSAAYRDVGPKILTLVEEGGELRIAREEMVSSLEAKRTAAPPISYEEATLPVVLGGEVALLTTEVVSLDWVTGHPSYVSDEMVRREVVPRALPSRLRPLLDADYELFDGAGERCVAKAKRFEVVARVVTHFGLRQEWEDTFAATEGRAPKKVPTGERALALWSLASNHPSGAGLKLVVVLDAARGCGEPVWGRRVQKTAPAGWKPSATVEQETPGLVRLLRTRPEMREATRAAREEGSIAPGATWGGVPEVSRFLGPRDRVTTVVRFRGEASCAYSTPWVLTFVATRVGAEWLVEAPGFAVEAKVRGLVDLDADGRPELVTTDGILRATATGYESVVDHAAPSYECPC